MKKNLIIVMGLMLCLCMSACGNADKSVVSQNKAGAGAPEQTVSTKADQSTTPSGDSHKALDEYVKVGGKSVYINYTSSRRCATKSSSIVFYNSKADVLALTYDENAAFSGTGNEALALLNDGRAFKNVYTYSEADFSDKGNVFKIDIESNDAIEVNALKAQKFAGSVSDNNGRKCYVYGYAFVIDGTPCALLGVDSSVDQKVETQKSLINELDEMVKTVRTAY